MLDQAAEDVEERPPASTTSTSTNGWWRRAQSDSLAYLVVLLGGEAGLRCGEIMALEWTDVDLHKRQLCVARSEWKGHVTVPKGGRLRYVPLTKRLAGALREARHLRGPRVLCDAQGQPLTQKVIQVMVRRAARRANVKPGVHILRHTFCSHLAMRGAPARAIQELAGHQDSGDDAAVHAPQPGCARCRDSVARRIRVLEPEIDPDRRGEIVEAAGESEGTEVRRFPEGKSGGGGGSRTRVRKDVAAGLYMLNHA